jgi:hypothetical protein
MAQRPLSAAGNDPGRGDVAVDGLVQPAGRRHSDRRASFIVGTINVGVGEIALEESPVANSLGTSKGHFCIMAKRSKTDRRVIMRIELTPPAKSGLEDMCERLGMTQVATTSRLIEWFSEQNDLVQASVLGLYPTDMQNDVPTMILKRMAQERRK